MKDTDLTAPERKLVAAALKAGRLEAEIHRQLIRSLHVYTERAGISVADFCSAVGDVVPPKAVEHLRGWQTHEKPGTFFERQSADSPSNVERCRALAGWFLRNRKDARVMLPDEIVRHQDQLGDVEASILLVPNLELAEKMPDWRQGILTGVLFARARSGSYTILAGDRIQQTLDKLGCKVALTSLFNGRAW